MKVGTKVKVSSFMYCEVCDVCDCRNTEGEIINREEGSKWNIHVLFDAPVIGNKDKQITGCLFSEDELEMIIE